MHNIVGLLSRRNNFTYWKVMAGVLKTADADSLVQALQIRYKKPFFLQDMHYYFDFKPYDQKYGVPTKRLKKKQFLQTIISIQF